MPENMKSKGGHARAKALSADERSQSARKAALARWTPELPQALYEAPVRVGEIEINAAVLPNGQRLLNQATFLRALGRSRSPKAGTGILSTADGLPFFLQAEQLAPFLSEELRASTTPIAYLSKSGRVTVGYNAELLPMVCEAYLQFRDSLGGKVPGNYSHIVAACDMLLRGLARVGIIALVDEATGYQEVREKLALQAILDRYLLKELAAWAKRFPDEFYQQIFRLRGWEFKDQGTQRSPAVAKYTNDIVYARLAPGILDELQSKNPKDEKGRRKAKHHQWLTDDVGHPALAQHLYAVIGFMRISSSWEQFMTYLDLAYPKLGDTRMLPFMAQVEEARSKP
jgi:hypothetical protein